MDTSCIVSIALADPGAPTMLTRLKGFDRLVSANLLQAELWSAMTRERLSPPPDLLAVIRWIIPVRPLGEEIARVLDAGYVRGADCWHLATALYIAPEPGEISFLTLDVRQRAVARLLGFRK